MTDRSVCEFRFKMIVLTENRGPKMMMAAKFRAHFATLSPIRNHDFNARCAPVFCCFVFI